MRTVLSTLTALGLAALLANPAWAQGRGFGMGGMGGPGLAGNKSVQDELKVDDKQKDQIKEVTDKLAEKRREAQQAANDVEGAERFQKVRELMQPANDEANKALATILKPEQLKRFKQITLQAQGAQAFASPEVQADLKLTDEQKEKIKGINDDAGQQMRDIFQNAGDDRAAAREKIVALRKETIEKIVGALTDEQKKTWKEKTGEPFEVKYERPGN